MSRSVTKIVLLVSAPLVAVALVSLIGSRSTHPTVATRVAPINVAFLKARHAGPNDLASAMLWRLGAIAHPTAGENIAWSTNPSMAGINTMFMNSPEHRANILNRAYHRIGVGVATNGSKTMVVEVFSN